MRTLATPHLATRRAGAWRSALRPRPSSQCRTASMARRAAALWAIASPRFLFSFALGIRRGWPDRCGRCWAGALLAAAAVAGAVLFERALVSPLWNFAMRFASKPAQTLESAVTDEATAVTVVRRERAGHRVARGRRTDRADPRHALGRRSPCCGAAFAPGNGFASKTSMPSGIAARCLFSNRTLAVSHQESLYVRACLRAWCHRSAVVVVFVLVVIPLIVASFLRNVEAGTIRLVSWLAGGTVTYRGPGKSKEIPLLTTGTTISSKVINIDLDITDQTADIDDERHAASDQGARARQRHRVGRRQRRADQDRREPLLLEERRRSAEHADRSALELGPSRHEPAHARPALLGQDGAAVARAGCRCVDRADDVAVACTDGAHRRPKRQRSRTKTIRSP